jgi:hypothetical protein
MPAVAACFQAARQLPPGVGVLTLSHPRAAPAWRPVPQDRRPSLEVVAPDHPQRGEVEAFIQSVYAARYRAQVRAFMPALVALRDADGELVAAAGYRCAAEQPLFLERYLAGPVECQLPPQHGAPPARRAIAEVGHLASARAGQGRRLILQLGPHLAAQGFDWVVSTTTEELRHLFARLGIVPLVLGVGDPALLGAEAAAWGSYYEHRPLVLAGRIAPALQVLARQVSGT